MAWTRDYLINTCKQDNKYVGESISYKLDNMPYICTYIYYS